MLTSNNDAILIITLLAIGVGALVLGFPGLSLGDRLFGFVCVVGLAAFASLIV